MKPNSVRISERRADPLGRKAKTFVRRWLLHRQRDGASIYWAGARLGAVDRHPISAPRERDDDAIILVWTILSRLFPKKSTKLRI